MINVSKYHGLGNDFVMLHYEDVIDKNHSKMAISLCDRNTGIGADGLIIVRSNPLEMIYYNSDGSRAEMCGNGIRCFAKFVYDNDITKDTSYNVYTLAGVMKVNVESFDPFIVEINMGRPNYNPKAVPVKAKDEVINKRFNFGENEIVASSLLMGVPHTVVEVDTFSIVDMVKVGRFFENTTLYPKGTNVNFYQVLSKDHIKMQTFERGAGLTLACGTGACATFAHLNRMGEVNDSATVSLPLGDLTIRIYNEKIYMSGPAVCVFNGTLNEVLYK